MANKTAENTRGGGRLATTTPGSHGNMWAFYYINLELRNSQNLQNGVKWPYIEELTILHHYENRNSVV